MINTKKIFDKTIQEIAKVVKLINEDGEDVDSKIISDMNDDISDLHATLFDGSNDFVELKDLKNYIKDVVGKDYFSDKRCWEYLYDSVYEVFTDIPNEFDESMQTGLGMAQQLPTNVTYDGELDDLYNFDDEEEKKKMNKRLEEKRGNAEDEKLALAQFLDIDVEEVEDGYTDHLYEAEGEEYWVSDYDTAYDEAVEECENLFDDMGLEAVSESTQEYFLENEDYCSFPWKDDMHEYNLAYATDIDSESGDDGYATRLVSEAIDRKVIKDKDCFENDDGELDYEDKDELAEMLADDLDDDYDSMSEWFESIYGRGWAKEMRDTLKDYLDYHAMAEYVVDEDGIENTLARYDGKQHSEKVNGVEYYIYRTN